MQSMTDNPVDPIIAELRAVRDAHATRFDYDVSAIFRDIREKQEKSGREYVRFPARRLNRQTANFTNCGKIDE